MPPVPSSQLPACSLCGDPVEWAALSADSTDSTVSSDSHPAVPSESSQKPTDNGQSAVIEATASPTAQPPAVVPNPVCQDCCSRATATSGEPIDGSPSAPAAADEALSPYTAGPNPVVIDGVTCWRTGTESRWQLCRDTRDSPSCRAFLRHHTDSDGEPIQWFVPDQTGRPVQIRTTPKTTADLAWFCQQFDRSTAFQIEPTAQARVPEAADAAVVDLRRTADSDGHEFAALTVAAPPRRVELSVSATARVEVSEPTAPPPAADAQPSTVARFQKLAEIAPGCINPSSFEPVISDGSPRARFEALRTVASVVEREPAAGIELIDCLSDQLKSGGLIALYAARAVRHIAAAYPEIVAREISDLSEPLTAESTLVEAETTRLLLYLAEANPAAALDTTPALSSLLSPTPTKSRRQALATVGLIAEPHPEAIRPLVPQLCSLLETDDAQYRISSTAALGRVTAAYPDAATPAVPTLVEQLQAVDSELRGNAVGVLGDIAREFPKDIAPYTDEIAPLLEDDDPTVRSNTAGTLARIASSDPLRVQPSVPALLGLLEDSWTRSRVHACWALGYCGDREATEMLSRIRHTDPSEAVRDRAAWALDQIE